MMKDASKIPVLAKTLLKEIKNCSADIQRLDILKTLLGMSLKINSNNNPPLLSLTPQESQCLLAAAHGKTSFATGKLLGIKASTVETHRKSIKQKLGCTTIAQAVFIGLCCNGLNVENNSKNVTYKRKKVHVTLLSINLSAPPPLKMLVVGHSAEQLNELGWLNNSEFTVEVVNNGLMALEKFDEGYDLLLIKNDMKPGLSGLEMMKILHETRSKPMLPVVLI